ncbi:hypothetical protein Goshw_016381 [Gossypium schwendimanii]|uniref:Uncharacterized protein n=1 Tax=Gossypium schwendimanii TaxID=34291 RepID=A0A7J9L3V1_GOSSC|nr:hypothetical protein [Gossypium schwendimanii]
MFLLVVSVKTAVTVRLDIIAIL